MRPFLWVISYLGQVLLLVAVVYDFSLKHLSPERDEPVYKRNSKRQSVFLILAGIVGIVGTAIGHVQTVRSDKAEAQERAQQAKLLSATIDANAYLIAQTEGLRADTKRNADEYSKLLMFISTNGVNPGLLTGLIEAKRHSDLISSNMTDLQSWISRYKNKRDLMTLQHEQDRTKEAERTRERNAPIYPAWDYAIRKLQLLLAEASPTKSGENLLVELPSIDMIFPMSGPRTGGDNYVFGPVTIGTNSAWRCDCSIHGSNPAGLELVCKGTKGRVMFCAYLQEGRIVTGVNVENEPVLVGSSPVSNYEKTVDEYLGYFIAAQVDDIARDREQASSAHLLPAIP